MSVLQETPQHGRQQDNLHLHIPGLLHHQGQHTTEVKVNESTRKPEDRIQVADLQVHRAIQGRRAVQVLIDRIQGPAVVHDQVDLTLDLPDHLGHQAIREVEAVAVAGVTHQADQVQEAVDHIAVVVVPEAVHLVLPEVAVHLQAEEEDN